MTWLLLAWHWVLGHALFAGGLGALVAMLASGPTGWAVLRWLIGTRPGLLVLCVWLGASALTWQKSVSYAEGFQAGAARSSALLAKAATAAAQAEAKAEEAARNAENTRAEAVNRIAAEYEKGRADEDARVAGLQHRIAAGDYVLRDEFRCPVARAPGTPAGNPAGAAAPAAPAWLLPPAFVSTAFGAAHDADRVLDDLYLCRDTLAAERVPAAVTP